MKNKKKQKMKLNKIPILLLALIVTLGMAAGCGKKPEEPAASSAAVQEKAPKSVSVTLTKDQVQILTDAKLLSGVQDYIVETGTDVDFAKLISYDKNVFEGVDVDDKKVDYKKTGDYKVAYLLTIDNAALKKTMKGKEKTVSFPEAKDAETILAGYESKVSVMTKEEAAKAAEASGDEKPAVINTATYNETVQHNQNNVSNHAQAQSAPVAANASNGGNAGNGNNGNADNQANGNGNTNANAAASNNVSSDTKDKSANNKPSTPFQHSHNWVEQKKLVHHDPVTEQRWVEDSPAFDEPVYEYHTICDCGIFLDNMTNEQLYHHIEEDMMSGRGGGYKDEMVYMGTVHHEATGHYETVEVTAAWDEMVGSGTYICPACGATK